MKKLLLALLLFPAICCAQEQVDLNKMSTTEIESLLFKLRMQADQTTAQIQQVMQVWQGRVQQEQGKKSKKND